MRLKKWVKIVILVITIVMLCKINDAIYKKSIKTCIEAGHTAYYCENGLK